MKTIILALVTLCGASFPALILNPAQARSTHHNHRVIQTIHKTQQHIHANHYRLGGHTFDLRRGIYRIDCSSFVDAVLKRSTPQAFADIQQFAGHPIPNSFDYYRYIRDRAARSLDHWRPIEHVKALRPGDIIAFHYKHRHRRAQGHIVFVMSNPKHYLGHSNQYVVKVADSSPFKHSQDTRRHSGIGIGKMVFKTDPHTGHPIAYAWRLNNHFEYHMLINMARPL